MRLKSIFSLFATTKSTTISPVTKSYLFGRQFYIKRDDLLVIGGINGNKVRKLKFLIDSPNEYTDVFSFGGYQSNAMVAIAKLVRENRNIKQFTYFTKHLPHDLLMNPVGNLKIAMDCGMKVIS